MDNFKIKVNAILLTVGLLLANVAFGQQAPYLEAVTSVVTPTVTGASTNYDIGDSIGGMLTFTGIPTSGIVQSITISDIGAEAKSFQLCLFDTTIAGTVTDNAAFDPTDADIDNLVGCQTVTDFQTFADNGTSQALQVGMAYRLPLANSLYGVLIDKTGGYYFDSTTALTITLTVYR